ncbi:bifunctional DNA-formamidopyrimidine glycosylase/DNA-(apurinic or apyrimidinic site) lyase [Leucobacter sp. M11]|uniref:bifunctional DNA-formamidopyrimidine glycosylase/DNA-(apurinic or apyrimidinic site) lyase n=1 Tax=Leucobacter sp. M11 TaxID=2993565 RepID=UPI002D7F4474|nr:bifunctional DNA-formamidopyrimidine glycosylase/DNA-(apurinic or apyrimidinic site) lyase [Leucobacter sp. M11]MEB4613275.1 bifunctional DNA-formamidopyrimidine glycosylase/DNA-(apurinic or apyrimidinic site) lyase [Leucobacter sp. M11]
MPELPEVEVVRAGLAPALIGSVVQAVEVFDRRALKRHPAERGGFENALRGVSFATPQRRGKFLWLPLLEGEDALLAHLGMSGQMLLRTGDAPEDRFVRVRIWLENPEHGELRLDFADQRLFGSLALDRLVPTHDGLSGGFGAADARVPSQAAHIARDPLDPGFDDEVFLAALTKRKSAVKRVLLDQGVVSGIGNIYADEALWAAQLHPEHPATELSREQGTRLLEEVRTVFRKALREGGTSFDAQYVNVNGEAGYFAHSLNSYGRTGEPCNRCGTAIKRIPFAGRSSHFCPRCQRLAR